MLLCLRSTRKNLRYLVPTFTVLDRRSYGLHTRLALVFKAAPTSLSTLKINSFHYIFWTKFLETFSDKVWEPLLILNKIWCSLFLYRPRGPLFQVRKVIWRVSISGAIMTVTVLWSELKRVWTSIRHHQIIHSSSGALPNFVPLSLVSKLWRTFYAICQNVAEITLNPGFNYKQIRLYYRWGSSSQRPKTSKAGQLCNTIYVT